MSTLSTTIKLNCWEFKNCGREKGGLMVDILGLCPVSTAMNYDGLNDGVGAGRSCWMVRDSVCRNSYLSGRPISCHQCEFYKRVVFEQEEEVEFKFSSVET